MTRKKARIDSSVVFFDVFYEDGSRASNRKVPGAMVGELDGDAPARTYILDQDRKIADLSGKPLRTIERIVRSVR